MPCANAHGWDIGGKRPCLQASFTFRVAYPPNRPCKYKISRGLYLTGIQPWSEPGDGRRERRGAAIVLNYASRARPRPGLSIWYARATRAAPQRPKNALSYAAVMHNPAA